jgi:radical SAM superfamily enzyme YgiQ (UPF0313 family)
MNVLIIATNRNKLPVAVMPFGACLVADAAEKAGHSVQLVDLMFARDPVRELEKALRARPTDVVGFSVRNIDNNDMRHPVLFFEELSPLLRTVRALAPGTPVILGGAALGVMPEEFLRYTGADYAVPGYGRSVFPQVLAALAGKRNAKAVPGVAWLENGRYTESARHDDKYSAECFVPDFTRWLDTAAYASRLSAAPLQTKQGCPFNCVYCTYNMSEGRDYRLFSPGSVVHAVKKSVDRGLREIEIVDNVFNSPYEHAMAVCKELAHARTGARLQTVELNPQFVDDHLLDAMELAGFTGVGITAESAADRVLKGLGKSYTSQEVKRAALAVSRHRLPAIWMFMLGGPGETQETVVQTLRFAADYIRPKDTAFFNVGVRIYPGTKLEQIARKQGVLMLPRSEMFRPVNYVSPSVGGEWIVESVQAAMEKHYNFINSDSLSLKFLPGMYRVGSLLGFTPPLWRHISSLRRGFRFLGVNV